MKVESAYVTLTPTEMRKGIPDLNGQVHDRPEAFIDYAAGTGGWYRYVYGAMVPGEEEEEDKGLVYRINFYRSSSPLSAAQLKQLTGYKYSSIDLVCMWSFWIQQHFTDLLPRTRSAVMELTARECICISSGTRSQLSKLMSVSVSVREVPCLWLTYELHMKLISYVHNLRRSL
jgi:hypothetical protein